VSTDDEKTFDIRLLGKGRLEHATVQYSTRARLDQHGTTYSRGKASHQQSSSVTAPII
jgi:hypothetical protein